MLRKTQLALMVGYLASGFAGGVLAQDNVNSTTDNSATNSAATNKPDTLIVTSQVQSGATKLATPDIETPQSVSIVTREQMLQQGATNVRQALGYTPGVYNNQVGGTNRFDYIVMRGFSDGSLDNVFLDGLKIMGDTNSHSSLVVDPWFLESMEVVRGPASVLYGRASPGGIVALSSRRPAFEQSGQIKLFAGNNAQRGAAFDLTGPLDDDDRVAFRLGGIVRKAETQFTTKEERYVLMPSLTWRISDKTRLDVMAYLHRDPEGGSHSGVPYEGSVVPHNGRYISNGFYDGEKNVEKYDRRQNMVGYNIEHNFDSGWSVRQKVRYLQSRVHLDQVYGYGWSGNSDELIRYYQGAREKLKAWTLDNQLDGSIDTGVLNHRLLLGMDYQQRQNDVNWPTGLFPNLNAFNPVYGAGALAWYAPTRERHKLQQTGFYAQDQISLDRWRLTLGGRYDTVKISSTNQTTEARSELDQGHFSERAALLYLFDNGVAPYVSYSTAFTPTNFTDASGNLLKPMEGKQWETGLKYQPVGTQDQYSVSLYRINQTNVATKTQPSDPYRAIGEIESEGVELEALTHITDNLSIQAAYSYNDIRYKKSGIASEQGQRAVYAPRNQLSAWVSYDVTSGILDGLMLGSGVRYVNGVVSDRANTHTLPSYTLVDMAVGYDLSKVGLKGLSAQLNVNNLTDKRYVGACNSLDYCYFGAERSVVGSLSYSF